MQSTISSSAHLAQSYSAFYLKRKTVAPLHRLIEHLEQTLLPFLLLIGYSRVVGILIILLLQL